MEGDGVGLRTRHTAVAVHRDYEEHARGKQLPPCIKFIVDSLVVVRCNGEDSQG